MKDQFQDQIQQIVREFVARVTEVAKQAAMQTLINAVGNHAKAPTANKLVKAKAAAVRGKGEKRSAEEMEALRQQLLEHIQANPGQRVEEINAQLGTETSEVHRPLKHLIADGLLRTEGQLRATRYYPGTKSTGQKKKPGKKPSKKAASKVPAVSKKTLAKKPPSTKKTPTKRTSVEAPPPVAAEDQAPATASTSAPVVQKGQIEDTLRETGGKVETAAAKLGIPGSTLRGMIKRLGIHVPRPGAASPALN